VTDIEKKNLFEFIVHFNSFSQSNSVFYTNLFFSLYIFLIYKWKLIQFVPFLKQFNAYWDAFKRVQ